MTNKMAGEAGAGRVNPVGFMAAGYEARIGHIRNAGIEYEIRVPGGGQRQVFTKDPNGVSVELSFDAAEATDGPAGAYRP